MTDTDQINEKSCCLIIKGGRLTGQVLAAAMRKVCRGGKWVVSKSATCHGKISLKKLAAQGTLANFEIRDDGIKQFEGIARKYGVDFAIKKDVSKSPPHHLVFFKSRDKDSMMSAFMEFDHRMRNPEKRRSLATLLREALNKVKAQVLGKSHDRGRER